MYIESRVMSTQPLSQRDCSEAVPGNSAGQPPEAPTQPPQGADTNEGSSSKPEVAAVRVLICGDVCGHFRDLATYLENANKKQGPFQFALCSGNFLGNGCAYSIADLRDKRLVTNLPSGEIPQSGAPTLDVQEGNSQQPQESRNCTFQEPSDPGQSNNQNQEVLKYLSGLCDFPVPVYFIDSSLSATGAELRRLWSREGYTFSPTLQYLGGFGFRTLSGLVIGFLSGRYDVSHFFSEDGEEQEIDMSDLMETPSPVLSLPATETSGCSTISGTPVAATSSPLVKRALQRYFKGPYGAYYCRSVLHFLKEQAVTTEGSTPDTCYAGRTDIFLSCEWPAGVEENLSPSDQMVLTRSLHSGAQALNSVARLSSTLAAPTQAPTHPPSSCSTSPAVSELVELLEPRYHIAGGAGVFYQRPLYRTSARGYAARFIGLGTTLSGPRVSEERCLRFLHALILKPLPSLPPSVLLAVPASSTPSPYFDLYNPQAPPRQTPPGFPNSNPTQSWGFSQVPDIPVTTDCQNILRSKRCRDITPTAGPLLSVTEAHNIYTASDTSKRRCNDPPISNVGEASHQPYANGAPSSVPPPPPPPASLPLCVFVNNIPFDVDTESLMEIMTSFGEVTDASIPRGTDGRSTGRAWITYGSHEDAAKAVAAHEQLQSGGRLLRLQFSTSGHPGARGDTQIGDARKRNNRKSDFAPQAIDVRPHSANPNCEKRLIIAVGEKAYVAMAKGGIVPQHVLVIPVTHFPNFVFCPPDVANELQHFILRLREFYLSQDMDMILYERYFPMKVTTGMHMQLQVVPVPKALGPKASALFRQRAQRAHIQLTPFGKDETIEALRRRVPDHVLQAYFYLEVPGEASEEVERWMYTASSSQDHKIPFNFGREVLAELLSVPERVNWQNCVEPDTVETKRARELQAAFFPHKPATSH